MHAHTDEALASSSTTTAGAAGARHNKRKVLPYLFDDAELDDVLVLVADMLTKLTQHNDSLPLHPSSLTRFHSRATPNITLPAYLARISKYTSVEKCCTLILLVYIDRVCERMSGFTICGLTVHRFVCAAVLCASKALCDSFNTNAHHAKVGGLTLAEMNLLEREFLQCIDWRLTCSGDMLQHYYVGLVKSHDDFVLHHTSGQVDGHQGSDQLDPQAGGTSEANDQAQAQIHDTQPSAVPYTRDTGQTTASLDASPSHPPPPSYTVPLDPTTTTTTTTKAASPPPSPPPPSSSSSSSSSSAAYARKRLPYLHPDTTTRQGRGAKSPRISSCLNVRSSEDGMLGMQMRM